MSMPRGLWLLLVSVCVIACVTLNLTARGLRASGRDRAKPKWPKIPLASDTCANGGADDPRTAVSCLAQRISPLLGSQLRFERIAETNPETFEIEDEAKVVLIRGSSTLALASGLKHYLHRYANSSISWTGRQISTFDAGLPRVGGFVRKRRTMRFGCAVA